MNSAVELPAEPSLTDLANERQAPPWIWVTLGSGIVMILFADAIASALNRLLPSRATIRSSGSVFDAFKDAGTEIVARTGWVIVVSVVVALCSMYVSVRIENSRIHLALTALVVVASAVWYGWLSTPHNAFASNARYHWVDYITSDSDDYLYALGRIPHYIFYETPWLWQSINAALAVALCYLIARRMAIGRGLSTALSSVVAVSGNLLHFADTAEDTLLSATLLLFVSYASLRRIGWLTGLALTLLVLGRPAFAVVALAVPASEAVAAIRHRARPASEQLRYVGSAALVTGLGVLASQIYFTFAGRRYFLNGGRLVYVPEWEHLTPIAVDGFTISAWSGAFAGHMVWVIPFGILVAAGTSVMLARRQSANVESTVYFAAISAALVVAVAESRPLFYYNVRYITYALPLLLVAAWGLLVPGVLERRAPGNRTPGDRYLRSFVASILVLSPMTIAANPVDVKRSIESRPEVELLAIRDELRELSAGGPVYTDSTARTTHNYLSYIIRDGPGRISALGDAWPTEGLVIVRRQHGLVGATPDLQTKSYLIYDMSS